MKLTNVCFCAGAGYCHAKCGPSKKWNPNTTFGCQKWTWGASFSCQKWTGSRMIMHVSVNLELDKMALYFLFIDCTHHYSKYHAQ